MNRNVIFWGCGKIAKEMYCKYKEEFTLLYGISNNPEETLFIPEKGQVFQIKRPEIKKGNMNGVIVICSVDYKKIAEQLSLLGYVPFVDFMDYELAEVLWTKKKIVLLYGFCHLRGIADCLRTSKIFSEKYSVVYYPNYLFLDFYQQGRMQYLFSHCDILIYGMAASKEGQRKNAAILGKLASHVKRLCLQAACFGCYFPQKERKYNGMNEFAVKSEGYDYTPFSYGDSWLNECIAKGMSLDDMFEQIEKGLVYDGDFILKYAEKEWKRLKYQEQESDFKIVDYIEKNYKEKRLFRNETHMENVVLYQYVLQVLRYLGCVVDIDVPTKPLLNCSQHIIYPCVANALDLKWDVWQEPLDLYTYDGWKKVTFREYVQEYFESCKEIMKLKKKALLP